LCAPALVYISSEFDVHFTVAKTTVLLADINDFGAVNEVYKQCKLRCNMNSKVLSFAVT
jgi:hypothetical protein